MKYNSLNEFFEHANNLIYRRDEINRVIEIALANVINSIKKKLPNLKHFLENDYSLMKIRLKSPKGLIKKLSLDQKQRNFRTNLRLEATAQKEKEDYEKNIQDEEEKKKIKGLEYKKYIESMQSHSAQRKFLITQSKSEMRGIKKQKWLYQLLTDEYMNKPVKEEIKKRKQVLLERKKQYLPIRINEIIKHSKQYSINIKEKSLKKINRRANTAEKIFISPFIEKLLKREKDQKSEEENLKKLKKIHLDRSKNYSKLVKDLYPPKIDLLKKKELEIIKQRILLPVPRKIYSENTVFRSKSEYISSKSTKSGLISRESIRQKKSRINYLHGLRSKREERLGKIRSRSFEVNPNSKEDVLKQAYEMDKLSRQHERFLKLSSASNWGNILKAEESANNLLVQSVKSKLSLLCD